MTDTLNAYELARLADCHGPDTLESPGAMWLLRVADAAEEARTYEAFAGDRDEGIHELADVLVPVYTSQRFDIFHDLAAWGEDVADYGPFDTMEDQVAAILYAIARRLLEALLEERDEDDEEEEE